MRTPRSVSLAAAALLLGGASQSHAAYQAVDTFNALTAGAIGGQNSWVVTTGDTTTSTVVVDPDNASNKVLRHAGSVNDAYKPLPVAIANASGGTLFYRLRINGLSNDISFGLSDAITPSLTDFATFEIQSNVTNTDGRFGTRDGGANQTSLLIGTSVTGQLLTLSTNVWYNVWIVANTTADTFEVYMQRDGDALLATQTQIRPPDGLFNFRNGAGADPLVRFHLISNSANTNIYLDDIYIDTLPTANLTNPLLTFNPDADADGLDDAWETLYFGNTTAQNGTGNPDGDSATNEEEESAGSNPNNIASTPLDTDADGLLDSWEATYFGNKSAQVGTDDFDGDGATNEQEETASTNPANAGLGNWPDADGDSLNDAWEITHFGSTGAVTGGGDFDTDGADNAAEMAAGSDPKNSNWTPSKAVLKNRWSFNGDLLDSVGTSHATIEDPDANAAVGGVVTQGTTSLTLTGGVSTTSAAVKLGANLVGARSTPVTVQLWATHDAVQNWGRIFDFGSSTTEYLFMSWTQGTNAATDQVEWIDGGVVSRLPNTNTPYTLGVKYHIVLTLTPAAYTNGAIASGTRVTWYTAPATNTTAPVARGTFDTALNLANLNDLNNWLGRSMWAPDNVASATYDEVRIWNGALTPSEVNTYQLAGPGAFAFTDTDSDGLSDPWEIAFFGDLSQVATGNPDADAYTNAEEYAGGSNPNVLASIPGDTDGDTLPDHLEIQYFGNLSQIASGDPDGDGATNLQEFQAVPPTNPNSAAEYPDADFDSMNDAWELLHFGTIAAGRNADPDDDGYTNVFEFDNRLNPNNYLSSPDSDLDGLVDGWEVHYFKQIGETGLNDLNTIIARQSGTDDLDIDGFSNALEALFVTDPSSAASVPGDYNNDGINDGPILRTGDVLDTTSFNAALNWHDAAAPIAGKAYFVGLNGLRTPTTGDHTFAGDRLVMTTRGLNVGTLIWKTPGTVTFPLLQFDGALLNQAAGLAAVPLNGNLLVTAASTLWANNGSILVNAALSGTGDLSLTGNNLVTFAGPSTWTGNLDVVVHPTAAATNRFTLAPTGVLKFAPGAAGVTNAITGVGTLTLEGQFVIDTSGASSTLGHSWTLVANTGVKTYAAGFSVTGFSAALGTPGSRQWISGGSAPFYQFDEATGVLTVVTNPDADGDGLADVWENTYFGDTSRTGTGDFDSDGSTDAQEYAAATNPILDTSWPDTDADGLKDTWEIATFGNLTTATITDKDGDSLLDAWELTYFASIATQSGTDDSDGDSHTNLAEQTARSNPALTASVPGDINADGFADGPRLLIGDLVGTNSFVNGLNWSGAQVPVAGQNYIVDVQSLRTPADAANYAFAGDRLVLFTGGNLLAKGSGTLSFPLLVLDGGQLHNGTDGNISVTVGGAISVPRASTIYAQNQGIVLNAALSGTGNLSFTGDNLVTIAGVNTWRGGLNLGNTAGFTLAATGNLVFAPGANGITNAITGTNPATLNGVFNIDLTGASQTSGASWTLVATSGVKTYGASFTVAGFTADASAVGARKWASGAYTFDEATGVLSVTGASLSALETWRETYFGTAEPTGDAADAFDKDSDGVLNLVEYALGRDPTVANSASPTMVAVVSGVLNLSFAHIDDPTLQYVIEASSTLASWTEVQAYTGYTAAGSTTYIDNVALTSGVRRFLRLKIVSSAP